MERLAQQLVQPEQAEQAEQAEQQLPEGQLVLVVQQVLVQLAQLVQQLHR